MTNPLDNRVELGKEMWKLLADTFYNCAEANKITTKEDLGALFGGFMASASGSMLANVGPEYSMAILDSIRKVCVTEIIEDISTKPANS